MALVMTLIEYIAGVIFIKGMKVKLWDYSKEKFNFQGIICLRFSIYWAILGAVYYFLIHPHILNALNWFSNNLAFSFVVGMFFGIFGVDLVYSLGIVKKINKEKLHWFLRFASGEQLRDHLQRYLELQRAFNGNPMEEWRDTVLKQYSDDKKKKNENKA